jgi:transposase-like protein
MLSLMAFVCEASARIDSEVHMPSFDVVSELDDHEIANAVDQANREVQQRFDFKDSGAKYELKDYTVTKTVLTDDGPVRIEVPRDRTAASSRILIPKHERRFTGFDDKIIAMYARGMTVREIQATSPRCTASRSRRSSSARSPTR